MSQLRMAPLEQLDAIESMSTNYFGTFSNSENIENGLHLMDGSPINGVQFKGESPEKSLIEIGNY